MRALESGNDPFQTTQQLESFQRFVIGYSHVRRATNVLEISVLRPNTRIVQTGRDRMCRMHLSRRVLQQIAQCAVQNSWRSFRERRGVMLRVESLPGRLYSDELNLGIVNKLVKSADRV